MLGISELVQAFVCAETCNQANHLMLREENEITVYSSLSIVSGSPDGNSSVFRVEPDISGGDVE